MRGQAEQKCSGSTQTGTCEPLERELQIYEGLGLLHPSCGSGCANHADGVGDTGRGGERVQLFAAFTGRRMDKNNRAELVGQVPHWLMNQMKRRRSGSRGRRLC